MANVTLAAATTGNGGGAGATFNTASFTRTAGKLYIALILNETNPADVANHAAIAGWGFIRYIADAADRNILGSSVLSFDGDGSTGALSITFGGVSQSWVNWHIIEVTPTSGTAVIVQHNGSVGVSGNPATTLAAFSDANNVTLFHAAKWFTAITPKAGYTPLSTDTGDVPMLTSYVNGQDTAPNGVTTGGDDWNAFAAELGITGGGGGGVPEDDPVWRRPVVQRPDSRILVFT